MKSKIAIVTNCFKCPYSVAQENSFTCVREFKEVDYDIPEWCPLPDYKEEEK